MKIFRYIMAVIFFCFAIISLLLESTLLAFILIILGFYLLFFNKLKIKAEQIENGRTTASKTAKKPKTGVSSKSSIKTSFINVDSRVAKGCNVSVLDLNGYISPSGGYMNYAIFELHGINPKTKRENKCLYKAKTEEEAIKLAEKDGFTSCTVSRAMSFDEPTERQIDYLKSFNVPVPGGACKYDISAILSRLIDSDDIVEEIFVSKNEEKRFIRPMPSPSEELAIYADEMGLQFSKYISEYNMFEVIVYNLKDKDRAAFYAYCVVCVNGGMEIGNLLKSPSKDKFYTFADIAVSKEGLVKSINDRKPYDYKKPHKGSIAYKAVAEYFGL